MTKDEAREQIDRILEKNLERFLDTTAYVIASEIAERINNGNSVFKNNFLIGYFPEREDFYDIKGKQEIFNIWQSQFSRPIRITSLIRCGNKYPLFAWEAAEGLCKKPDFALQLYNPNSLFGRKTKSLEYILSKLPSAVNRILSDQGIGVDLQIKAKYFVACTTANLYYSYRKK